MYPQRDGDRMLNIGMEATIKAQINTIDEFATRVRARVRAGGRARSPRPLCVSTASPCFLPPSPFAREAKNTLT